MKKSQNCRISPDFRYDEHNLTTKGLGLARREVNPKDYPLSAGSKLTDGLEMIMHRVDQEEVTVCLEASFSLHSSFELPNAYASTDDCDFDFQKSVTVSIVPEVVTTDESLRSIEPKNRNCFFDGEKELKFLRTYSKVNCEMECISDLAMQNCNCTPFYFVRNESTPVCYLNDLKCIKYNASPKSLRYCGCLARCNTINYRFEVRSDRLSTSFDAKLVSLKYILKSLSKVYF